MIKANNSELKSWIEVPENSDFPIQNIPFGVAKSGKQVFVASRIGDTVINLHKLAKLGYFDVDSDVFKSYKLNKFIKLGKSFTRQVRDEISAIFSHENAANKENDGIKSALHTISEVEMLMPVRVGDYTDFYSSEQHAYNVGCMFRDPNNALLPNWKHIPVGYHGRSSSIVVSGTPIHRPKGQQKPNNNEPPVFGPCKLLDFELEMAFVTYNGKALGQSISTKEADDYIFGMCIFNDWSARDIQKWEYVPLGPFLAKNFASSISPWIVTLDALEPFRVSGPVQEPKVFDYLQYEGNKHIDINLEVAIQPENTKEKVVSNSNYKYMYWNMNQQLAHHTVNGCNIKAGDMMASGTISGNDESAYGSMLEISWKGSKSVAMTDGSERKFILDNDTVIMRGFAQKNGVRVGFGEVRTKVLPTV
ncbi:MAG: fumarylacetoacetase [Flavobacteriales bacterium]|nr:fumarylacetoacetase [Flavobacteriales bacterium]MCW8912252.1 fumarylacetoacetase [Flavobacteriales bacterium]MCW8937509.1 fumarylacetoacetase [Flavobacteriales bacterium]MCW8941169.1 fumarylacetoacetase [Flavobacteriales bacterium]MCW8967166.1 fumarylacetoacetase [Flavobacteriales bacterium]